jgi:uncharacterized membrane protein YraQ (UPF0718 family)
VGEGIIGFSRFVLMDGTLLVGLFLLITWLVVLVQQRVPFQSMQTSLLGTSSWKSSFVASVGGVITPFCSCSTIPVLSGMLRAGVGFAPSFAFLISSPVVNEGVFTLLLLTHGPLPAVIFIVAGLIITSSAGLFADSLGLSRHVTLGGKPSTDARFVGSGGPTWPGFGPASRFAWLGATQELRKSAPYLIIGLVIGGLIYGAVPRDMLLDAVDSVSLPTLFILCALIGLPLYISPLMAIPIGLSLIEKGFPAGPLVTFLVSAIGTSPPEVALLFRMFKLPLVIAHTLTVILSALALGAIVHMVI